MSPSRAPSRSSFRLVSSISRTSCSWRLRFPSTWSRGRSSVRRLFRLRGRAPFWVSMPDVSLCRELAPVASLPGARGLRYPGSTVASPRETLRTIRDELQQIFLERTELIDGALVALLAGQHVLVIGPPGTAKSMLADEVCGRLTDAHYFQWLLTRFTTPEELFGAVSLKALEQ